MNTKDTEKKQEGFQLSDNEVLEILNQANSQYEKYLEIASLGKDENNAILSSIKRNINHPLNLVLK